MVQDQQRVITIRTLECDICDRYDSIMLSEKEIVERVNRNSLQIGSRILSHGNHLRIVYFDIDGNYLGDTMSINVDRYKPKHKKITIPRFIKSDKRPHSLHRRMLQYFMRTNHTISIVGPSMAGKTSLTRFLESGIPERESQEVHHPATMGKSVKHFELAKNHVKIFDMGGQQDYWSLWSEAIEVSDKIIFVLDGTANNIDEIQSSLQLVVDQIKNTHQLLIVFNKLDLVIDGYTSFFVDPELVLQSIVFPDKLNYWVIQCSVYNGLVYNYSQENEETLLSTAIVDFMQR